MQYTCCAGIEYYDAIAKAGYDEICLPATNLMECSDDELKKIRKKIEQGPIKCTSLNMFCKPSLRLCGSGYNPVDVREYAKKLADRASCIGVKYIGIGAPKSRSLDDCFDRELAMDQLCESFSLIDSIFDDAGIMTLIEAVYSLECNFIVNTIEAFDIYQRIRSDSIGIVYDLYHAMAENERPEEFKTVGNIVKILHIAENVNDRRCYLSEECYEQYDSFFRVIRECGFDGICAVEAFAPDIIERLDSTLNIMRRLNG